jgi:twitching motility two-component system response regulator PilH
MKRRHHDRPRRHTDRLAPAADHRRVLLVGPDQAWRLLTAYVFEEAGFAVYAAADRTQAVAFTSRLLPDAVVMPIETPDSFEILVSLSKGASTRDIPVVVLTPSLQSNAARRARKAGGLIVLDHDIDVDVLVGEVERLIDAAPRAQRTLKRRLLDIQELARFYTPDEEGQNRLRRLIDRLQVAIFAVDAQGHCIAASQGATVLTGYSRRQLLTTSVFDSVFAAGHGPDAAWRTLLIDRPDARTTTITNRAGKHLPVHAAAVAEVMPGFHVAAFAAT